MRILNIGCGKDYIEGAVNIDINSNVKCDMRIDIGYPYWQMAGLDNSDSAGFPTFSTKKFGSICLEYETFDKIIAHDVLEHIPNLTNAMTNCRNLLKIGGEMDIIVPYDLSLGAWSDPTHVRGFNERSWIYYAEWSWYIGWKDTAFACTKCEMQCADWVDPNTPIEQLSRMPRAVESMKVTLKKVHYVGPKDA